ncbi:MAG: transketolase [Gracilibacteraceae bacterium]|jgi:transketolase|nr:transketolase [Gracilibacteraceae bacterium]
MTSKELAWKIRRHGIEMTSLAKGSHIASVLSVADIVAVLYNDVMKIFPRDPASDLRDRFILSKGHAGAAVYAALAEEGYFATELLRTHCQDGSFLSGHVSHKGVPGVELSTGSLGHGLGVAAGMALAALRDGKQCQFYAVLGDGECDEGSVWEAALFANHYRLRNLTAVIDHNKMQSLDYCEKTLELLDLAGKWRAFGWRCLEVDGHDHEALREACRTTDAEKPVCVVAHTVKGKGVSFMENNILWHYRDPQGEFYEQAIQELELVRP